MDRNSALVDHAVMKSAQRNQIRGVSFLHRSPSGECDVHRPSACSCSLGSGSRDRGRSGSGARAVKSCASCGYESLCITAIMHGSRLCKVDVDEGCVACEGPMPSTRNFSGETSDQPFALTRQSVRTEPCIITGFAGTAARDPAGDIEAERFWEIGCSLRRALSWRDLLRHTCEWLRGFRVRARER